MTPARKHTARPRRPLTDDAAPDTLTGGTVGSQEHSKSVLPSVSVAADRSSDVVTLGMALDAVTGMFAAVLLRDRRELDAQFENLVGCVEEWRDAVPKA